MADDNKTKFSFGSFDRFKNKLNQTNQQSNASVLDRSKGLLEKRNVSPTEQFSSNVSDVPTQPTLPVLKPESFGPVADQPTIATSDVKTNVEEAGVQEKPFSLGEVTGEFTTEDLTNAFTSPVTEGDLDSLLRTQQELRRQILGTFKPTEEEKGIAGELADLRERNTLRQIAFEEGLTKVAREPISAGAIGGEQAFRFKQQGFEERRFAAKEANLLARLGLAQNERLTTGENLFKIEALIRQDRQDFINNASQLRAEARESLNTILTQFAGIDFDSLSIEDQLKLTSLAEQVGIPATILQQGMEVAKQQLGFNNLLKQKELEAKDLDILLKRKQISLLGEPTAQEKKETAAGIKEAQASIPIMENKIDLADEILESSALSSRVGPNIFSRLYGPLSQDEITGEAQNFAGGVHKLISGLTLDNLIEAKSRGATFGALSDSELEILAASASQIADWEIKNRKGEGIGVWNINEEAFKNELRFIQQETRRALALSRGTLISPEEQSVLDEIFIGQDSEDLSIFFQ